MKCCPNKDDISNGKGGFHFCENPIDIFRYYEPASSVFHAVEGGGETEKHTDDDTKVACTEIKIGASLSLHDLIGEGIKFFYEKRTYKNKGSKHSTGDSSASSATGDSSAAVSTGLYSKAMGRGVWLHSSCVVE